MPAGHFLTHIQHDPVVACLVNREIHLVDIPLTYLPSATFRCRDIHHFAGAFSLLSVKCKSADVAGVEVRFAVVVPQDAITLARDEHGDGDLRVHLRQSATESTHVAIAVLELSEAKEIFVLGRIEGQRGFIETRVLGIRF